MFSHLLALKLMQKKEKKTTTKTHTGITKVSINNCKRLSCNGSDNLRMCISFSYKQSNKTSYEAQGIM